MGASSEESGNSWRPELPGKMLKPRRGCFQPGRGVGREKSRWLGYKHRAGGISLSGKTTESWTRASPVEPRTQSHPPVAHAHQGLLPQTLPSKGQMWTLSWLQEPKLHPLFFIHSDSLNCFFFCIVPCL